jgi:hypothetical protein
MNISMHTQIDWRSLFRLCNNNNCSDKIASKIYWNIDLCEHVINRFIQSLHKMISNSYRGEINVKLKLTTFCWKNNKHVSKTVIIRWLERAHYKLWNLKSTFKKPLQYSEAWSTRRGIKRQRAIEQF